MIISTDAGKVFDKIQDIHYDKHSPEIWAQKGTYLSIIKVT